MRRLDERGRTHYSRVKSDAIDEAAKLLPENQPQKENSS